MSTMKNLKNILDFELSDKSINSIDSDYKSEVVIANLIDEGYDPDRIFLIRNSGTRRGFSKDIEKIELQFSEHDLQDYLYIYVNKEGIYDILPERVFHRPLHKQRAKTKEDIIDEIKTHRQEEFFARRFFQPFEAEVDYAITKVYLHELKFDKKISNKHSVNLFSPYWSLLEHLTTRQSILFMYFIPLLHKIRKSNREIGEAISQILDISVKIEEINIPQKGVLSCFESKLGDTELGVNFVLGNSFDDGEDDIQILLGPLTTSEMEYFIEPSVGNIVLDKLCNLFLPANKFWIKKFDISPENAIFILPTQNVNTFLGVNTFI